MKVSLAHLNMAEIGCKTHYLLAKILNCL